MEDEFGKVRDAKKLKLTKKLKLMGMIWHFQVWCDNVPKRTCDVSSQTNVKLTPKTECKKEVAKVCGPETCPIVKGERICKDEIKTVRILVAHVFH